MKLKRNEEKTKHNENCVKFFFFKVFFGAEGVTERLQKTECALTTYEPRNMLRNGVGYQAHSFESNLSQDFSETVEENLEALMTGCLAGGVK